MPLSPEHLKELQSSAISPEQITKSGYQTVTEVIEYGFPKWQSRAGLLYPLNPPDQSNGLYQFKPDNPRSGKDGKPVKYEHPFGKDSRLDIGIGCHQFVNDPTIPAIITEGRKKVDSLISNFPGNWLLVNLCSGVFGWLSDKKPIPDLDLITWTGRHCYLIFDNDVAVKAQVRYALEWLASELRERGAFTSVVYLPENNGKKLGVDDWFYQGGKAGELLEMMRLSRVEIDSLLDELLQAKDGKQKLNLTRWLIWRLADVQDSLELKVYLSLVKEKKVMGITDLLRLIKERQSKFEPETPTDDELRDKWLEQSELTAFGLSDWRRYDKGIWPAINKDVIKGEIEEVIEDCKKLGVSPDSRLLGSVYELARIKVFQPDNIWDSNPDYLPCANGTLHIPTRTLSEHDPNLYFTSGVSFDYDSQAQSPGWDTFLFDLGFRMPAGVCEFLQEFAGYSLTIDTSHELALWLYGEPGSGKSTFLTGLEAMLGSRAGLLGLADITSNRFALADIPGKTLVVSTEQPGDYIASSHVLNAIISGEPVTIDRKFMDAIRINPRCKLAWAMNELPRVSDPNSGLFRRVKVVEFPVIAEANRDPQLKETIRTEGAGILNWALVGLDRLRQRGKFEIPQAVKEATDNYKNNNDIPKQYLDENCTINKELGNVGEPKFSITAKELYQDYSSWCLGTGHKPMSMTRLASEWNRLGLEKYASAGKTRYKYINLKSSL